MKAMLKPRKHDGLTTFYFSTNTSSMRVAQYRANPNACLYFYHKGLVKYVGVMLTGSNPTPGYAAQLMVKHIEDYGFTRYEMGYAAAVSVGLLGLIYAFSFVARKLFSAKDE